MTKNEVATLSSNITDTLLSLYARKSVVGAIVQYTNPEKLYQFVGSCRNFLKVLSRSKRYLNIGTGPGILEYIAKQDGFNIDTVEWMDDDIQEFYNIIRNELDIEVDYQTTDYFNNYSILNCPNTYDAIILNRFGPFQMEDNTIRYLDGFLDVLSKYSDTIICHYGPASIDTKISDHLKLNYSTEIKYYNKSAYMFISI